MPQAGPKLLLIAETLCRAWLRWYTAHQAQGWDVFKSPLALAVSSPSMNGSHLQQGLWHVWLVYSDQ